MKPMENPADKIVEELHFSFLGVPDDKLEYIRSIMHTKQGAFDGEIVRWLVAEVDRGRKVEDDVIAVRDTPPGRTRTAAFIEMLATLEANPRPGKS